MAILDNGRSGPGYLAVELRIDKRLRASGPFNRGQVFSWDDSPELDDIMSDFWENLKKELNLPASNRPPVDRSKIGWLNCTIKFIVGESVIFQQGLLVQYGTFWDWFYGVQELLNSEHEEEETYSSGMESPELCMRLSRTPYDPDYLEEGDPRYGCSMFICVDTGVAAGDYVSGNGPGMFLSVGETAVLTFARELLEEAHQAG
jgi:hypothetical protein